MQKLGDRPEQQDRYHVIRPGRLQQEHIAIFGVYDGQYARRQNLKVYAPTNDD